MKRIFSFNWRLELAKTSLCLGGLCLLIFLASFYIIFNMMRNYDFGLSEDLVKLAQLSVIFTPFLSVFFILLSGVLVYRRQEETEE